MTEWDLLHKYRRLAAADKVPTLACSDCNIEYVTFYVNDKPIFWCPGCNGEITPGGAVWTFIEKTVKEQDA